MPKHSTTWSNSAVIRTLARGRWDRMAKQSSQPGKSGVVTYLDKKGRKRCHGTPQLKRSQSLDWMHETSNILFLPCWFLLYYYILLNPECLELRRYPAGYARTLVDLFPMFRCGSDLKQVPEAHPDGIA